MEIAPQGRRAAGTFSELATGARLLGRGFGIVARSPRLLMLGIVPGVISALIVLSAFGTFVYYIDDLAALATWFADDWSAGWRDAARLLAGIGLLVGGALLAVFTFTALTLTIGDPFYEEISKHVDELCGGAPDAVDTPWYRSLPRSLVDSARLLAVSLAASVVLFACGFIPVVGQTVVPVVQIVLGGWFLATEISGVAFGRRAYRLRHRRLLLRPHRALTLGFGIPIFLMILVPFAAVLIMPGAVAGGTLLARRVLGQSHEVLHSGH